MPIIQVEKLTKKFNGFTAVDNISFNVEQGEIFAFLGPNGSGKTTTIKMLTTLLAPTSGKILVNQFNVLTQKEDVRKSFGIVFQDPSLDNHLTAYDNMFIHAVLYNVPKEFIEKRIKELLSIFELWDKKNWLVRKFSGGMKRRLEIARALLHEPKIIFLDEPTLGLDPQTRNKLWNYTNKLNNEKNITIFFTTHYLEEAERIAKRIAIIDHGKIVKIGSLEELKKETKADSLEQVFLHLTGHEMIDEEENGTSYTIKSHKKGWQK